MSKLMFEQTVEHLINITTTVKCEQNFLLFTFLLCALIVLIPSALVLKLLLMRRTTPLQEVLSVNVKKQIFLKNIIKPTRSCSPKLNNLNLCQYHPLYDTDRLLDIVRNDYNKLTENIDKYCRGGYMPIESKQIIRYNLEIVRKLGWGHFFNSLDGEKLDYFHRDSFVAVKIIQSSPKYRMVSFKEISLLEHVKTTDPSHPGHKRIIFFSQYFFANSINGVHLCLTFELMGPSLLDLLVQSNHCGLEQPGVKKIITQVLLGLTYLHHTCQIIHTDLKPENILIKITNSYLNELIDCVNSFEARGLKKPKSYVTALEWNQNKNLFVEPEESEIFSILKKRVQSCPSKTEKPEFLKPVMAKFRKPLNMPLLVDPNIQVKIADLGNSCWESKRILPIQTEQYRALEVIIGADYSYPADIWSVACITFELCTGAFLFEPYTEENLYCIEYHLALIWKLLGGIPLNIARSGSRSSALINLDSENISFQKIGDILKEIYKWNDFNANSLEEFLESLLNPIPRIRPDAFDALNLKWLNN